MAAAAGDGRGTDRRELDDDPKLISAALGYLFGSEQQLLVPRVEYARADPGPVGPVVRMAQPEAVFRGYLWPCQK